MEAYKTSKTAIMMIQAHANFKVYPEKARRELEEIKQTMPETEKKELHPSVLAALKQKSMR